MLADRPKSLYALEALDVHRYDVFALCSERFWRERRELVFDPKSSAPVLLLNGASVDDSDGVYRAFSLVQHVGTNGSAWW